MTDPFELIVSAPGRADAAIATEADGLSRTRARALIKAGAVELNGTPLADPAQRLAGGDVLVVRLPPPVPATPQPEAIPLDIVFEDEALVVLNKPPGLVVHPAAGHGGGTLVNALIHHCGDSLSGIGGVMRPGIVHRLDKDTSGVMVVAKTDAAHKALAAQFADHGRTGPLQRAYDALVWGAPPPTGTIDRPIGRHPADRQRFAVRRGEAGKFAITHYACIAPLGPASHVRCRLETGRTHQIRVHMADIGHPVVADPLYARGFATKAARAPEAAQHALATFGRQALHATHLAFAHPVHGETLAFDAPWPTDLADLGRALQTP